ncbi:MAG: hypothetical protein NTV34_06870, partial [Proteobacteria bacterium]|nr:hypothetical protein [Pseudomonadota bacterium]
MRKALTMIVALALCFTVAAWWFVHQLDVWAQAPKSIPGEVIVELRPRMTLPFLSRQLADKEVITDHTKFQLWMRLTGGYGKFQAGNYLFTGDVSPRQVRDKIMRGENYVPSVLQVA